MSRPIFGVLAMPSGVLTLEPRCKQLPATKALPVQRLFLATRLPFDYWTISAAN
jgi:hypothetical protein